MKIAFFISSLLFSFSSGAKDHSLHAHEHGAIKVGIAVEKNVIEIDIDGPAESFLGFEYMPKTDKEKKQFSDLKDKWIKNLEKFFIFDPKLKCLVEAANFEQIMEELDEKEVKGKVKKESGTHSEIEATAKVRCVSDAAGSDVTVALKREFKKIKKLEIEIVSTTTKSIAITKPVQVIKL